MGEQLKDVLLHNMALMDELNVQGLLTEEAVGRLKQCEEIYCMLYVDDLPKEPDYYKLIRAEVEDPARTVYKCDLCGRLILRGNKWIFDDDVICGSCIDRYIDAAKV